MSPMPFWKRPEAVERFVLLDEGTLNTWMDRHGFSPQGPVRRTTQQTGEGEFWHNLHAHYRKRGTGPLSGF